MKLTSVVSTYETEIKPLLERGDKSPQLIKQFKENFRLVVDFKENVDNPAFKKIGDCNEIFKNYFASATPYLQKFESMEAEARQQRNDKFKKYAKISGGTFAGSALIGASYVYGSPWVMALCTAGITYAANYLLGPSEITPELEETGEEDTKLLINVSPAIDEHKYDDPTDKDLAIAQSLQEAEHAQALKRSASLAEQAANDHEIAKQLAQSSSAPRRRFQAEQKLNY